MHLLNSYTNLIKKVIPGPILKKIKNYRTKRKRFSNEIRLLNGQKFNKSEKKSVIFFTTVKCASTYMDKCLSYINERYLNLHHINFGLYFWLYSSQDEFEILDKKKSKAFQSKGFLYSPMRNYYPVPEIEKYCILLMLRDPRDVLVSHYYSVAYSHPPSPNKLRQEEFLTRRSKVQKMTVDEYVVEKSEHFMRTYSEYCNYLVKDKNINVLRYEDFMENFDLWLEQLEQSLKIIISQEDKNILYELKGGDTKVNENKLNHIRKATPGDYKNKLTEETQDFLNSKFKDILLTLNYE